MSSNTEGNLPTSAATQDPETRSSRAVNDHERIRLRKIMYAAAKKTWVLPPTKAGKSEKPPGGPAARGFYSWVSQLRAFGLLCVFSGGGCRGPLPVIPWSLLGSHS